MTIEEFNSLKIGDVVFAVINSGITGISKYQYIGIFKDHERGESKHVFLSQYFVSTICIPETRPELSRRLKNIFIDSDDADNRHEEMKEQGIDY